MTSEEKTGGLPTWAKVLIGLVAGGMVIGILAIVGGVWYFGNMMKQAQDPTAIAKTARQIAEFPDPLPQGYQYKLALPIAGINTVAIEHDPDKQMIMFVSYPQNDKSDPKKLIDEVYEKGFSPPGQGGGGKIEEVKSRGTELVGGAEMPYIVGSMTDKSGTKIEGMIGCVVSKDKGKTVLIYGMQPGEGAYRLDVTKDLLKTIKTF